MWHKYDISEFIYKTEMDWLTDIENKPMFNKGKNAGEDKSRVWD